MHIKSIFHIIFLISFTFTFCACTSDELALNFGEDVINDDHQAFYTEVLVPETKTILADYVKTNNTGVALCGSYRDEYIGDITTNTVFKVSPYVLLSGKDDNDLFDYTAVYDSVTIIMPRNGYLYGDSTKEMYLSLYELGEEYDLDTFVYTVSGNSYVLEQLNNNSTTTLGSLIKEFDFIPAALNGEPLEVKLSDVWGQKFFDNIIAENDNYVIPEGGEDEGDERFIENVLPGLTIRNNEAKGINSAIVGFHMPTSTSTDTSFIKIRLHYHTTSGSYIERHHDFSIYEASHQYNQVSADYTGTVLDGITAEGEGIASDDCDGMTFIHSGLGLMTEIEIPSIFDLYQYGTDFTVINMDVEFSNAPLSSRNNTSLPSTMSVDEYLKEDKINPNGLVDYDGDRVAISQQTSSSDQNSTFSFPITKYANDEIALLEPLSPYHNTIVITASSNGTYPATVDRMVIGDHDKADCEMMVKTYYTFFDH